MVFGPSGASFYKAFHLSVRVGHLVMVPGALFSPSRNPIFIFESNFLLKMIPLDIDCGTMALCLLVCFLSALSFLLAQPSDHHFS